MAAGRPLMVIAAPERQTRSPATATTGFSTGVLGNRRPRETATAMMSGGNRISTRSPRWGMACVIVYSPIGVLAVVFQISRWRGGEMLEATTATTTQAVMIADLKVPS